LSTTSVRMTAPVVVVVPQLRPVLAGVLPFDVRIQPTEPGVEHREQVRALDVQHLVRLRVADTASGHELFGHCLDDPPGDGQRHAVSSSVSTTPSNARMPGWVGEVDRLQRLAGLEVHQQLARGVHGDAGGVGVIGAPDRAALQVSSGTSDPRTASTTWAASAWRPSAPPGARSLPRISTARATPDRATDRSAVAPGRRAPTSTAAAAGPDRSWCAPTSSSGSGGPPRTGRCPA